TDISERSRAKYRVGDGVQQHVSIGMPKQPALMLDPHTTEHHGPAFGKAVDVVADTGANLAHLVTALDRGKSGAQKRLDQWNVARPGQFHIFGAPLDDVHRPSQRLEEPRFVGNVKLPALGFGKRLKETISPERLRSLGGPEVIARNRRRNLPALDA